MERRQYPAEAVRDDFVPKEDYLDPDFARHEAENLWPKVWQIVCRLEEIPNVGDYITYEILTDSIIVTRSAEDEVKAFHNACPHRGNQLVDGCGNARQFVCSFHGWRFRLDGRCVKVIDRDDWGTCLSDDDTNLSPVQVGIWGGWVWINMDPNAAPLDTFLGAAGRILAHFEMDRMRYKWRQWTVYPCNWKTALEAFMEPYHVAGTHTQLLDYAEFYAYSVAYDLHGVSGFDQRDAAHKTTQGGSVTGVGKGDDARISTYELVRENYQTVNFFRLDRNAGQRRQPVAARTARGDLGG